MLGGLCIAPGALHGAEHRSLGFARPPCFASAAGWACSACAEPLCTGFWGPGHPGVLQASQRPQCKRLGAPAAVQRRRCCPAACCLLPAACCISTGARQPLGSAGALHRCRLALHCTGPGALQQLASRQISASRALQQHLAAACCFLGVAAAPVHPVRVVPVLPGSLLLATRCHGALQQLGASRALHRLCSVSVFPVHCTGAL